MHTLLGIRPPSHPTNALLTATPQINRSTMCHQHPTHRWCVLLDLWCCILVRDARIALKVVKHGHLEVVVTVELIAVCLQAGSLRLLWGKIYSRGVSQPWDHTDWPHALFCCYRGGVASHYERRAGAGAAALAQFQVEVLRSCSLAAALWLLLMTTRPAHRLCLSHRLCFRTAQQLLLFFMYAHAPMRRCCCCCCCRLHCLCATGNGG
jgi:hypothetical protein